MTRTPPPSSGRKKATAASNGEKAAAALRQTYTLIEAAKLLGIGRNQAYEAAKRGDIPTIPGMGKRRIVPKAKFDRLLAGE